MLCVRCATQQDSIDEIMQIYAFAQNFMIENGNPTQWAHVYPARELIEQDVASGVCHLVCEADRMCGVFALFSGIDPTYIHIEDGAWLNDEPYITIHRIAGNGSAHGILKTAVEYCKTMSQNIRIDTHHDNKIMQKKLEKYGFQPCGIIYVEDGSPRIAYQWTANGK